MVHLSAARYPTGSAAQSFSPFRPHDSLPPPSVVPGASSRYPLRDVRSEGVHVAAHLQQTWENPPVRAIRLLRIRLRRTCSFHHKGYHNQILLALFRSQRTREPSTQKNRVEFARSVRRHTRFSSSTDALKTPSPRMSSRLPLRSGAFSNDRGGGKMSTGEDSLVPALMLKLKSGPASPGALVAVDSGSNGGEVTTIGGHHRCGGMQPHHGSVKWAPPWTTRRIGSGGEGGFRSQPSPSRLRFFRKTFRVVCADEGHAQSVVLTVRRPETFERADIHQPPSSKARCRILCHRAYAVSSVRCPYDTHEPEKSFRYSTFRFRCSPYNLGS